ncbi:MAG: NUDIX hydrolase [Deinococcaceae bacterium]
MTETLYTGPIFTLERIQDRWDVIRHSPAVAILAQKDGRILIVRQHRIALGTETLEIPAGLIDPGETPLEAAQRELSEECNLGGKLTLISRYYASPGFCDEEVYVFSATDLFERIGEPDEDENIEVTWMDPRAVLSGLLDGSIKGSSTTLVGCLWALQNPLNLG